MGYDWDEPLNTCLTYSPCPRLRPFVDELWYYDGSDGPRSAEVVLPHGSFEMVISLSDFGYQVLDKADGIVAAKSAGGIISGLHSRPVVTVAEPRVSLLGVYFKPGGAFPLLGCSTVDLENQCAPLDLLWGSTLDDLRERLVNAPSPVDKFAALERWLLQQYEPGRPFDPGIGLAVRELTYSPHPVSVGAIERHVGMSPNLFIRRFREQVGMAPKRFARIHRFQRALRLIDRTEIGPEWLETALACGYFDQAHFVREFRAFAGMTPSQYLVQRGPVPNRLALTD